MKKDIHKYINNCALCKQEMTRPLVYPLQMTHIPDRPFDKIAIDLVSDLNVSASGNQHILTIIDHLMGWPEALPILDKKSDTIVCVFINNYLPIHIWSFFILSENGTEFKNQLMDSVLQQLGIYCIFSMLYHPQSNGKLEDFTNTLNLLLKKLCEKDPDYWDKYINQIIASNQVTPHPMTAEIPFFLVYGKDPNLPLCQLLEPMQ